MSAPTGRLTFHSDARWRVPPEDEARVRGDSPPPQLRATGDPRHSPRLRRHTPTPLPPGGDRPPRQCAGLPEAAHRAVHRSAPRTKLRPLLVPDRVQPRIPTRPVREGPDRGRHALRGRGRLPP